MEVGSGFAVFCHHCREIWSYVYFYFKPILYIYVRMCMCACMCMYVCMYVCMCVKVKQPLYSPRHTSCSRRLRLPTFLDNRHMKLVRLSALHTDRLYSPGETRGTQFCQRLSWPQGHRWAGRIMSMKNCNDRIGSRIRNLPACTTVPQPTELPRTPMCVRALFACMWLHIYICNVCMYVYYVRM